MPVTEQDKAELLPCPFCGSVNLEDMFDDGIHWTHCKGCGADGPIMRARQDEDTPTWSTRAHPSPMAFKDGASMALKALDETFNAIKVEDTEDSDKLWLGRYMIIRQALTSRGVTDAGSVVDGMVVSRYVFQDVTIDDTGSGWGVRHNALGRMSKLTGEFDYEPLPSSRTDEWIEEHNFPTPEEAARAYLQLSKRGGA